MPGFNRFADWRWAGFSAQKLVRRTELSATTKLSSGNETPPIANVLLWDGLLKYNFSYFNGVSLRVNDMGKI